VKARTDKLNKWDFKESWGKKKKNKWMMKEGRRNKNKQAREAVISAVFTLLDQ
jgi:hypothetical protein